MMSIGTILLFFYTLVKYETRYYFPSPLGELWIYGSIASTHYRSSHVRVLTTLVSRGLTWLKEHLRIYERVCGVRTANRQQG